MSKTPTTIATRGRGRPSEGRSPRSFRLRRQTSIAIAALQLTWGVDATEALERAVDMAARSVSKTYDIARRGPAGRVTAARG